MSSLHKDHLLWLHLMAECTTGDLEAWSSVTSPVLLVILLLCVCVHVCMCESVYVCMSTYMHWTWYTGRCDIKLTQLAEK